MPDPAGIGIVEAFSLLVKSAQALKDLATTGEIKARVTELYEVILAGQQRALESTVKQQAMLEDIRQLKEELASVKRWEEEKQRYQLTTPWNGCHVYALKESCKGTEPPHWICEHCYQEGRKSLLHDSQKHDRRIIQLIKCSHCMFENEIRGEHERRYV